MCDGDELNVVVDPILISVAERNLKEFDVVPLFYDANKAHPEIINREAIFKAIKQAHDCSGIGVVSNMLTRLWNRDKQDRVAAALLCKYNNEVIDGAKIGVINTYENYPAVKKRIHKAVGGRKGRMPAFFANTPNSRHFQANNRKERKFLAPNNSTMNRICRSFDDIGNINLNYAGIPPFNFRMLLSQPCNDTRNDVVDLFFDMDSINITNIIESQELNYAADREAKANYEMLAEEIEETMTERFGSLEETYPYIVKALFSAEGKNKAAHKQMFWRVYGDIALRVLKNNLETSDVCNECGTRIPSWVTHHVCDKSSSGFLVCDDCGKLVERNNSRQCRCTACQEELEKNKRFARDKERYARQKEIRHQLVDRLKKKGDRPCTTS